MSFKTLKTKIKQCKEEGLFIEDGENFRLLKLPKIINKLFPSLDKDMMALRFFRSHPYRTYKEFQNGIEKAFAMLNYTQQFWHTERNQIFELYKEGRIKSQDVKTLDKIRRDKGCKSIEEVVSTTKYNLEVYTGKDHLSNLLGCSPSTAAKRLNTWHNDASRFTREVKVEFIPCPVNHATFDAFKHLGKLVPAKEGNGYWVNKGSVIAPCSFLL